MSGKTFTTVNPTTNQALTTVADGQAEDIDRAVAAAKKAFTDSPWSGMKAKDRARILDRIADTIEAHGEELAQ
ncbi:aldehyde dehydrogenase family protein [Alicyclobacillus herbarius]|uniref:aldehyde dehydrogenase family protein n=1 Tax=Alicyclobacillus herbarius TaxID=122960 RepID=UPI0023579333|nr:aldehyde dehydrogenase family protein [Alicyclobacillus herbarius]